MDPRLTIAPSVSPQAAAIPGVIGQAIAAMPEGQVAWGEVADFRSEHLR